MRIGTPNSRKSEGTPDNFFEVKLWKTHYNERKSVNSQLSANIRELAELLGGNLIGGYSSENRAHFFRNHTLFWKTRYTKIEIQ